MHSRIYYTLTLYQWMNEQELKDLFVSSLESGHVFDSKNRNLPLTNPHNEIRVKSEGYFGQFDLVIAIVNRANKTNTGAVFDRQIDTGMFNLSKRRFAKTLLDNGVVEGIDKIYRRLSTLERIYQKLVFNELYNSNPGFLKEETEFLRQFSSIEIVMTYTRQMATYIEQSENEKISDYF